MAQTCLCGKIAEIGDICDACRSRLLDIEYKLLMRQNNRSLPNLLRNLHEEDERFALKTTKSKLKRESKKIKSKTAKSKLKSKKRIEDVYTFEE
jgi:NADH dehydrogenase/NADH:ubiquinone oxidoreductase subunit G